MSRHTVVKEYVRRILEERLDPWTKVRVKQMNYFCKTSGTVDNVTTNYNPIVPNIIQSNSGCQDMLVIHLSRDILSYKSDSLIGPF